MNNVLNYINNWPELAHETKWSASALAGKCNVSLRTLERYFIREMGESPKAWLARQRHLQAVRLLQSGKSVKEAAGILNFKYATHFSREFKRRAADSQAALTATGALLTWVLVA